MEDIRRVLKWNEEAEKWDEVDFKDLKRGDKFALYESTGEYVGSWEATCDAFLKDDVWSILI